MKHTVSMCPECYREIPAEVYLDGSVKMRKVCPAHGEFSSVVEVNPAFYLWCMEHPAPIYDGHLVDVTTRCNLSCKYCYYGKGGEDIPVAEIVNECRVNRGPYILTGGEPTLRPDLPEIIGQCVNVGPTYFLTNGTGLLDKEYLKACNKYVVKQDCYSGIGLSYHAEFDRFEDVVENLRSCEIKPHTAFIVIDSLDQLDHAKAFAESHRDLFQMVRIKCASNVWSEGKAKERVFASQVLQWFMDRGETKIPHGGKTSYFPFYHNGAMYAVISWYDVTNVDLLDISCPPTYRSKDGQVTDFVRAMLINEGMAKGFLNGKTCKG